MNENKHLRILNLYFGKIFQNFGTFQFTSKKFKENKVVNIV